MPVQYLVIGNLENRRVTLFQAALKRRGLMPAYELSYLELLHNETALTKWLDKWRRQNPRRRLCIRLESPGENELVHTALVTRGFKLSNCRRKVRFEHGRIQHSKEWFAGYADLLNSIADQVSHFSNSCLVSHPEDVLLTFDKPRCHAYLASRCIAVPPVLSDIANFDQLMETMRALDWNRVFVKLATGSSASGVVALFVTPTSLRAVTSMEMIGSGKSARFYNNLKLSCYRHPRDVAALINFLCESGVHMERWLPKAALGDRNFDLRMLVIGGQPMHCVVRTSRSPITNLHLGNRRGDLELLRQRVSPAVWTETLQLARDTAAAFPRSHMLGLDILLQPGFRRPTLLEANAFGDLLPGVFYRKLDSYEAQIRSFKWARSVGANGTI